MLFELLGNLFFVVMFFIPIVVEGLKSAKKNNRSFLEEILDDE